MRKASVAIAAAVLAVGFAPHPMARADDPCNNDVPGYPRFGHLVCEQMDKGLSSAQVAMNAMTAYGLTQIMAASLVSGAVVKYCPWDEGK